MDWSTLGYWTAVATSAIFSLLLTFQTYEHRRFSRSRAHKTEQDPRGHVALFVPCKGADADLETNLRPLLEQDYPDYEVVFIVESEQEPAAHTIRRLIDQYQGTPARLVVAGISTVSGQKVHNLLAATDDLPQNVAVLVFVDADVCPPRDWLRLLTGRLEKRSVSTGYRAFVPKRATLPNLILASINGSMVPIMFPGKHHLIWGGSWAIKREAFESIRLREAWRGTLSDDLIATRVMARERQPVAAEPMCVLPSPLDVGWREMFSFVRRQLIIGRCYVPVHWYALLLGSTVTHALFWGSIVVGLVGLAAGASWAAQPLAAAGLLYALHVVRAWLRHDAARFYLPACRDQLAAVRRFDLSLGPVAGVVGWLALLSSAFAKRIVWKGITYEMRPGGAIVRIARPCDTDTGHAPAGIARKAA